MIIATVLHASVLQSYKTANGGLNWYINICMKIKEFVQNLV